MFRHEITLTIGPHRFDNISSVHLKDFCNQQDGKLEAMVWTLHEANRNVSCPLKYEGAALSATRKFVHVVVDAPQLDGPALKKAIQVLTEFKRHTKYTLKAMVGGAV